MLGTYINNLLHLLNPDNYHFDYRCLVAVVFLKIRMGYINHYWNSWNLGNVYGACVLFLFYHFHFLVSYNLESVKMLITLIFYCHLLNLFQVANLFISIPHFFLLLNSCINFVKYHLFFIHFYLQNHFILFTLINIFPSSLKYCLSLNFSKLIFIISHSLRIWTCYLLDQLPIYYQSKN